MKGLSLLYKFAVMGVIVLLLCGSIASFFGVLPPFLQTVVWRIPMLVALISGWSSLVWWRELRTGKMHEWIPSSVIVGCTLLYVLWGAAVFSGVIEEEDGKQNYEAVTRLSENVVTMDNEGYIYAWTAEHEEQEHLARVFHDSLRGGMVLETGSHLLREDSLFSERLLGFFPTQIVKSHKKMGKDSPFSSLWFCLLYFFLVGLAVALPVGTAGLFPRWIFQAVFLVNVFAGINVGINLSIPIAWHMVVVIGVIVLLLLCCAIIRMRVSWKYFYNRINEIEKDFRGGIDNIATEEENSERRNRQIAPLLCALMTIPWLIVFFFAFPYRGDSSIVTHLMVHVIFVIAVVFFFSRSRKAGMFVRRVSIIFVPFFIFYAVYIFFFSPIIHRALQKSANEDTFKKELLEHYAAAQEIENAEEAIALEKFYIHRFPEDSHKFRKKEEGKEDENTGDISTVERSPYVSELLSSIEFLNLGQEELLQRATDYAEDGHFYAALLLTTRYRKLYDHKTERLLRVESLVQEHIEQTTPPYIQQARVQLQRGIHYLYDILSSQKANRDMIIAFYQANALRNTFPENIQLQWLVAAYEYFLEKSVFYASDVRLALLKEQGSYPVMFVERNHDVDMVWQAGDSSYHDGRAYFSAIELLAIDRREKKRGDILWHIRAPYATIVESSLLLYGIEHGNIQVKHEPIVVEGSIARERPPWIIPTKVRAHDVVLLQARKNFIETTDIVQRVRMALLWKQHFLPSSVVYAFIFRDVWRLFLLVLSALFLAYTLTLFSRKSMQTSPSILFVPGFGMGAVIVAFSYLQYVHQLLQGIGYQRYGWDGLWITSIAIAVVSLTISLAVVHFLLRRFRVR